MKKWWKQAAVGVGLMTMLAGCSDGESASTTKDGKVVLDMWVFGTTGYDELAKVYMEENPDVQIKVQSTEMGDHHNNLFTALSAGKGAPDIAMIEVGEIERYRDAKDRFTNLNDLGAKDLQDSYLDWVWNVGSSSDGEFVYGLPTDIGPTAMYYRKDVVEAAGYPTDPAELASTLATWADYTTFAEEVKAKTGKPVVDNAELIFNAKRDQASEHYFNRDNELIVEENAEIRAAYDYTADLITKGTVGNMPLWTPEWGQGMADGSYATLLGPAWMQGVVKGNAPDAAGNWLVTTMPEGAGNWGGSYLTIPKESEYSEEAYEFISWLLTPDNQLNSFKDMGLFPSTPETYEKEEFKSYTDEYFGGINTAEVFADAASQVVDVYKGKNYLLVQGEIMMALDNVLNSGGDPDKEWNDAMDRIKQRLERE